MLVTSINKKTTLLLVVALAVALADRMFFNRDLYADGSCMFLSSYFNGFIHQPLFSRVVAITFLHIPSIIASGLGVTNFAVLRFLWKIGYVIPFLISTLSISYLNKKFRLFGFLYLIFSISLFYLPNSMFAVGEYQIIFAIVPVLVSSLKELLLEHTIRSKIIFFSSLILLAKTYEIAAIFSLVVCLIVVVIDLIKKHRNETEFLNDLELIIFLLTLLYIIYNVFIDFRYMPEWLKENSARGFNYYLTWEQYGAFWDTFIPFQFIVSFVFLMVFFFIPRKLDQGYYGLSFLIFLSCLASLFANHQPEHSYTSKTIFLSIYLAISLMFIFVKIRYTGIEISLRVLSPILLAVSILLVVQGFGFNNYMEGIRGFVLNTNTKSNINTVDLQYFKEGPGRKYSWSWGQACISYLYSPQGPLVLGEFDREYSPVQIKKIIKSNELNK